MILRYKKKILLLGGSAQQIVAIETAKRLGYETVLCDYLPDNPGQHYADRFYLVSTTDKESVLQVAREEGIDGILAYASDPAAPTAAYVAEQLGLPTNPAESVEILCNKDRFRAFLRSEGFRTPVARGYTSVDDAMRETNCFQLPVIVKPVDSSGSKGATVLHSWEHLEQALSFAFSYSRGNRIIVEEFIEKKHPYLIGGDIFVIDGRIVLWGLLNCHRDGNVNPLVPVGKSYPLLLEEADEQAVHETLQRMVDRLGIRNGAMNVELVVDHKNGVFPIDVGPRNGGNMIPDLLGMIFGVDVVELSVKTAMGDRTDLLPSFPHCFYATHNLHSDRDGIFEDVFISPELAQNIVKKCIYKKPGDRVEYFDNASKALGIVFMKFDSQEEMMKKLEHINSLIQIVLKES
ncbi:MAG: ATP-grasp domain-containing protein [Clostridia bacterium]|nr:ATP-grasp domain-containing protein [Clostridia bacterium]